MSTLAHTHSHVYTHTGAVTHTSTYTWCAHIPAYMCTDTFSHACRFRSEEVDFGSGGSSPRGHTSL